MSEWQEVKLGTIVESVSETFKFSDKQVIFLNTSDILADKFLHANLSDPKTLPGQAKKRIKKGDLLFSEIRPANKRYALVNFDADDYVVSTKLMVLRPKGNIDPTYLKLFLTSEETLDYLQMIAEDRSGTFPQITFDILDRMDLMVPSLSEQKAIASVLSSLDDKIDLLHRQNTTLERIAETLFRQWFVEEAHEDWEVVSLGDLFEISSGKGLKKGQLSDTGLYPVLGANGLIGKTNDYLFNEKLIFTGRVGTLGNIFRVNNEKVWLSDNTLIFRNIKYFYIVYFALSKASLADYNVGSTQPLIRQSEVKAIEILIPKNHEKLDRFESQAELIFVKINSNQKQIQTLEKLRDNLLPKLMSGEVRVIYG